MGLTLNEVKAAMLAKLSRSLLGTAEAAKLKLKTLTADMAKAEGFSTAGAGFLIPYFTPEGKVTKFKRIRYVEDIRKGFDKLSGRKELRYSQIAGTLNEAYFPPLTAWQKILESKQPLIITEGELKAACATKMGYPTIGLGGVWCFKSNKAGEALIPGLKNIVYEGRTVFIVYDSDAATNPNVVAAENVLAQELTSKGAEVKIVRLPSDGTEKVGLDDYLLTHEANELKQLLADATLFSTCAALRQMSEHVVFIRDPGLMYDHTHNMRISVDDFCNKHYANYWHNEPTTGGKLLRVQTAKKWIAWECRSELRKITFSPGKPKIFDGMLNRWDGWAYEPVKGDAAPWKKLMDHLFSDTDKEVRIWFEQWCAYPIQNPGYKLKTGVLIWGLEQGSGKTIAGETVMQLYGKYAEMIGDTNLEDARLEWAEDKQFILADEITGQDNRKLKQRLKNMITRKSLPLNPKFIPSYFIEDRINYYFTSNDPDAFYMDDEDRRFFIHEVTAEKMEVPFRKEYVAWKNSTEGMQALMHYFMHLDLTSFDPDAEAYKTIAKQTMVSLTKGDLASWVYDLKYDTSKIKLTGDLFTSAELLVLYDPMRLGKVTVNGMARELSRAGFRSPGKAGGSVSTKFGNVRLWAIRNPGIWPKKSNQYIVEHYENNREMLPVGFAKRAMKFKKEQEK